MGTCLGTGQRHGISAGAHHVRCRKRRTDRRGLRKRMAPHRSRIGNRSGVRRALRRVGTDHRFSGGNVYRNPLHLRLPYGADRTVLLLHDRRMCGYLPTGGSDHAQCLRIGGHSASDRRDFPVYFLRRLQHAGRLGTPRLSESGGYPTERQLCRQKENRAGRTPSGSSL